MEPTVIASDGRPEVQALAREVGADDAALVSARLSSFLLWYEERLFSVSSTILKKC